MLAMHLCVIFFHGALFAARLGGPGLWKICTSFIPSPISRHPQSLNMYIYYLYKGDPPPPKSTHRCIRCYTQNADPFIQSHVRAWAARLNSGSPLYEVLRCTPRGRCARRRWRQGCRGATGCGRRGGGRNGSVLRTVGGVG